MPGFLYLGIPSQPQPICLQLYFMLLAHEQGTVKTPSLESFPFLMPYSWIVSLATHVSTILYHHQTEQLTLISFIKQSIFTEPNMYRLLF